MCPNIWQNISRQKNQTTFVYVFLDTTQSQAGKLLYINVELGLLVALVKGDGESHLFALNVLHPFCPIFTNHWILRYHEAHCYMVCLLK